MNRGGGDDDVWSPLLRGKGGELIDHIEATESRQSTTLRKERRMGHTTTVFYVFFPLTGRRTSANPDFSASFVRTTCADRERTIVPVACRSPL